MSHFLIVSLIQNQTFTVLLHFLKFQMNVLKINFTFIYLIHLFLIIIIIIIFVIIANLFIVILLNSLLLDYFIFIIIIIIQKISAKFNFRIRLAALIARNLFFNQNSGY